MNNTYYKNYDDILTHAKKCCCIDDDCRKDISNKFEKVVRDCILESVVKYPAFCIFDVLKHSFVIRREFPLMTFIKADWYIYRNWLTEAAGYLNQAHLTIRKLKRKL